PVMSLRLLQKSATGGAQPTNAGTGASWGRGRGGGRAGSRNTMSLGQFQQQASSTGASGAAATSSRSAWGRGGTHCDSADDPSLEDPTPCAAAAAPRSGAQPRRDPSGPTSRSSAWGRGPPSSAIEALWGSAPAADGDGDEGDE
ncbi:unnamed protein product, partial [Polarella glacialis]